MNVTSETVAATVAAQFPFDVVKMPLSGPDNMKTDLYTMFRVDHNGGGYEHVGKGVKKGYEPHTTEDVVTLCEAASSVFPEADLKCSWYNRHRVVVEPANVNHAEIYKDDGIVPRLIISARYDGKPFEASLGMYRHECSNLTMLKRVSGATVRLRHSKKLRRNMPKLVETFGKLSETWGHTVACATQMESNIHDVAEFAAEIYRPTVKSNGELSKQYEDKVKLLVERIHRERLSLGRESQDLTRATGWELFNAVQGHEQHEARRAKAKSESDRLWMTFDDGFVARRIAHAADLAMVG